MTMANLLRFPAVATTVPSDKEARALALDPHASFIVEAPAGSGKTGLLVQRFLTLLLDPEVDIPEEVLAITFTNKATAELRERVAQELHLATEPLPAEASDFDRQTQAIAAAVVARDAERGWTILANPGRLNIRSIDSVCAAISASVPVLSGAGGKRTILADAQPLYRAAAHRTLLQLGGPDTEMHSALRSLLLHRDGKLADAEHLLAGMLAAREQWGELIPLQPAQLSEERLQREVRPRLEATLETLVCAGLSRAIRLMPPSALHELSSLAINWSSQPARGGDISPLAVCASLRGAPTDKADSLDHWKALIGLVLKADGHWRLSKQAFHSRFLKFDLPPGANLQLQQLVEQIEDDQLLHALRAVLDLPPARYPDEQWAVAMSLFRILGHALVELKLLFAKRAECDFAELSLAAREALRIDPTAADLALAGGGQLRHLLVDEMQDTSAVQYQLLEQLTRFWDGRTQTLFLVGDPKQSIYLFRQARVERFLRTARDEALGDLPLQSLQLNSNFRSQATLVKSFNDTFDRIFPAPEDEALRVPNCPDVPFVEAVSALPATSSEALHWHATTLPPDPSTGKPDLSAYRLQEARAVRRSIQAWHNKPLPPERLSRNKPWSIAVLARTRSHLAAIAAELRATAIPYRAVEVDALAERQEILDALALTRALLHPADRIAWLAVLHAPWCGLGLADLVALTGEGREADRELTVPELVTLRRERLSLMGCRLLDRAWPVLQTALDTRGRTALSTHIQRTWLSLGGDAALASDARANVNRFFALLRELESLNQGRIELPALQGRLGMLYAEPQTSEPHQPAVELMTIHKAKGLEWDVVFVPGLERKSQSDRSALLNWLELDGAEGGEGSDANHILLAPIHGVGEASDNLNTWLRSVRSARDFAERKRVFYVACTRAREELHLFAALPLTSKGELSKAPPGSLLEAAWPAAEAFFQSSAPATSDATDIQDQLRGSLAKLDGQGPAPGLALAASVAEDTETGELQGDSLHEAFTPEPPHIHRLPLSFNPRARFANPIRELSAPTPQSVPRPEGSFAARAFGNVVHRYLELLAQRMTTTPPGVLESEISAWLPRLAASLRAEGLSPALAAREADRVQRALVKTLADPIGRWILTAHPQAASETAFTTPSGTMRADRSFLAGPEPLSNGCSTEWIIDFKTADQGARPLDLFRAQELAKYEPQLQAYATQRRLARGETHPLRLALYYPLGSLLLDGSVNPK
jgi:ATP-dependent helicase/nuclease subunit A